MTTAPSPPAPAPPKGYRPAIPLKVALEAAVRQIRCPDCGMHLGNLDNVQKDHDPPLQMRVWCEAAGDTIPRANDPAHIVLRHVECHREKTSGRKTKARAEGDVTEIARTKRLAKDQEEFRSRLLAKEPGAPKKQSKWGKRPLRSKGFEKRR